MNYEIVILSVGFNWKKLSHVFIFSTFKKQVLKLRLSRLHEKGSREALPKSTRGLGCAVSVLDLLRSLQWALVDHGEVRRYQIYIYIYIYVS